MARARNSAKNSSKTTTTGAARAKSPTTGASPPTGADTETYSLSAARKAELTAEALALGNAVTAYPGRSRDRVRWFHRIRIVALRDAAELVQAPFHEEPALTLDEITKQRDRIELFRTVESELQDKRSGQATASRDFATLAAEAARHKDTLLRAFDLRFRDDPAGQKRLSQIRAGSGDTDLVQDVSDISVLCTQHIAYLDGCPRGEGDAARRLLELSPELSHLLGAKTITEEARAARKLRDAAYTLAATTDERIRAAAGYWYGGTEKMKDYAAYSAPAGTPAEAENTPSQGGTPAPTPPADNTAPVST